LAKGLSAPVLVLAAGVSDASADHAVAVAQQFVRGPETALLRVSDLANPG